MDIKKSDWKLFRSKIGMWQENYMEKLVEKYIQLLSGPQNASEKFWELEKRIKLDRKNPGVMIQLSRSDLVIDLVSLINNDVITLEDLDGFSDELIERVKFVLEVK